MAILPMEDFGEVDPVIPWYMIPLLILSWVVFSIASGVGYVIDKIRGK